jgi:hypothetical protein
MSKPNYFILNSDFPTLKNDGSDSGDVIIPSAISIPGSSSLSYSFDLTIGVQGSVTRSRVKSTVTDTTWHAGTQREFIRTGTESGFPAIYSLYAFTYRLDATTLRCQVFIPNPYAGILTGAVGETISFEVHTFIPPFA